MPIPHGTRQLTTDTARDRAIQWLERQGLREGPNPDGSIVAIGAGPLVRRGSGGAVARSTAFDIACLDARNALATFLAAEIATASTVTARELAEGPARDALGRLKPGEAASRSRVEDATWVAARCELSGLLPVATFDTATDRSDGMLAVVLRHDRGSAALARALIAGEPCRAPRDCPSLEEFLGRADAERRAAAPRLTMMSDADGNAVLVSIAESDVIDEPLAADRAADRAILAARGALRAFAGQLQDGKVRLERSSTLVEMADGRSAFESAERYRRELEAHSAGLDLPLGCVARTWILPASGKPQSAVAVVVVGTGGAMPALRVAASLPNAGSGALVRREGTELRGQAVGSGVFVVTSPEDAKLHPSLRRSRALRAAVVNAKAALARALPQNVSTMSWSLVGWDGTELQQTRTDIVIRRTLLSGAALVRTIHGGTDERPECRAWIESRSPTEPGDGDSRSHGLPRFATETEAASAIAAWACRGLCDDAVVRVCVGPEDAPALRGFGVGLGAGPYADRVAEQKARAGLARARLYSIEGKDSLVRSAEWADPLGELGARAIFREAGDDRSSKTSVEHQVKGLLTRLECDDSLVVFVLPES